jgi:hypothetical protein
MPPDAKKSPSPPADGAVPCFLRGIRRGVYFQFAGARAEIGH